jgi:hypothetical protein
MQAARIFSIQIPRQLVWTSGVHPADWWNPAKQPQMATPARELGTAGIGRPSILLPQILLPQHTKTSEHPWREGLIVTDGVSD